MRQSVATGSVAMLSNHVVLPGSNDRSHKTRPCDRCGTDGSINDGVAAGRRFVCGKCWRKFGFRDPAKKFGVKK